MTNRPFFTVGIPVYNSEKWLGECLDSILNQSFTDFEIVCVNDGSTDTSLEVLNSYAAKDSRVKVVDRPNRGVSAARNAVLYAMTGRYLIFIDSDDVLNSGALDAAHSHITANSFPHLLEIGIDVNALGKITVHHPRIPPQGFFDSFQSRDERFVNLLASGYFLPSVCRKFISTDFIKANGLVFNQRYIMAEDYDFSCQLYRKIDTVAYGDFSAITYFHPREGSLTSIPSAKTYYTGLCQEMEMYNDMKYWNLSEGARQTARRLFVRFIEFQQRYCYDFLMENSDKALIMERVSLLEQFIGPHLKKTRLPLDRYGLVYLFYRIFGIKRTTAVLCRLLGK